MKDLQLIPLQQKDYMFEVNYIVNELKEKYKYSQADIARILDVNANTFNAWINGKLTCRHSKMLVLAVRQVRVLLNECFS